VYVCARAANLNNVQLMLLAIEGVGLCVLAMLWMWMLLKRVAAQRYSMLCVFMVSLFSRLLVTKHCLLQHWHQVGSAPG
jgi:hypothetical protein